MIDLLTQIVGGAFLLAGSFFLIVGAIGLNRMPDLFTRMHAASVGETLGGSLLLIGMMIHGGFSLVTFKLLVLLAVIFFFGPVATHAMARAARYAGVEPMLSGAPALPKQSAPETAPKTRRKTKKATQTTSKTKPSATKAKPPATKAKRPAAKAKRPATKTKRSPAKKKSDK